MKHVNPILKINPEFKNLIRPLRRKELLQLEENLLADGCREPIITWNGFIIDGHNRYELCSKHGIPFLVWEKEFDSKEEVIAWICANQLGRRNISEETRKYLIGLQYETEKTIIKNKQGKNQHNAEDVEIDEDAEEENNKGGTHHTAQRLADEHHISYGTVQKYASYTRALEHLKEIEPEIVPKILSGKYKIAHKNVINLALLPPEEIKKFNRRMQKKKNTTVGYKQARKELPKQMPKTQIKQPSIKDMPAFDPDATTVELSLTLPSWTSSIKRAISNTDYETVSKQAQRKLRDVLNSHIDIILDLMHILQEGDNE